MMNRNSHRVIAGLVLAALIATSLAPAAEAGERRHKNKRGHERHEQYRPQQVKHRRAHVQQRHVEYRPHRVVRYVDYRPHRVVRHTRYHRHHDGHGLAFLGGLVLGAVITHAASADHYYYVDPYCDVRFSSLGAYHSHLGHHRHPSVAHVIEIRSGDWVDSYHYDHGNWRYYDTEDWDH